MIKEPQKEFSGTGALLYHIWQSAGRSAGERIPLWKDFKARNVAPAMREAWVLEYEPIDRMIVRFVGSAIVHWVGQDTTGKDFVQYRNAPEHRKTVMEIYRTTYETPCATCLSRLVTLPGNALKEMQTTFFPLRFGDAEQWGLLGCSEMRTVAEKEHTQMVDTEGFTGAKLLPPRFVDLGFGLPEKNTKD